MLDNTLTGSIPILSEEDGFSCALDALVGLDQIPMMDDTVFDGMFDEPMEGISFPDDGPFNDVWDFSLEQANAESHDLENKKDEPVQIEKTVIQDKRTEEQEQPKKPKRSLSAYNFYFSAERKRLLESLPARGTKPRRSHGKLGFAEMARSVASTWKTISPDEKKQFEDLAAADYKRYCREMGEWKNAVGKVATPLSPKKSSAVLGRSDGSKEKLAPLKLKGKKPVTKRVVDKKVQRSPKQNAERKIPRPLSAYNLFFRAERKEILESRPAPLHKPRRSHGKMGFVEMARSIASRWKAITPEQKMHFEYLSALDAERYEREFQAEKMKTSSESFTSSPPSSNPSAVVDFVSEEMAFEKLAGPYLAMNRLSDPTTVGVTSGEANEESRSQSPPMNTSVSSFLRRQLCR
uniref:HMG box domain-containing protein n=1 Tax=Entomoneis paludosa TaxID=265537 RepID=A0A7S2Y9E1_9STRA|mmetsp:Transcript_2360/g.4932  ORF Transcript_2360/g.4932 Transcript_2360/m.4932 type:complete len:407 (+) Transcript_2360:309-1529(+)